MKIRQVIILKNKRTLNKNETEVKIISAKKKKDAKKIESDYINRLMDEEGYEISELAPDSTSLEKTTPTFIDTIKITISEIDTKTLKSSKRV
jgi:hypothetical protein